MPGPGGMDGGERQGHGGALDIWMRNLRNGKQRDQAHLLTVASRAGADFIAGKSDWQVVGEMTRRKLKQGRK